MEYDREDVMPYHVSQRKSPIRKSLVRKNHTNSSALSDDSQNGVVNKNHKLSAEGIQSQIES